MTAAVPRSMTRAEQRGEVVFRLLSWVEEPDGYITTTYEIPAATAREKYFCELKNPRGKIIHTTLIYADVESAVDVAHVMANIARNAHPARVTLWARMRARLLSLLASRALP